MRYAIYFVPECSSALWRFGSSAIGYDAVTGDDRVLLPVDGVAEATVRQATAEPRRYGFHGTLKPPFALTDGANEADLLAAVERFAAGQSAFEIATLKVAALSRFLALVPDGPSVGITELAAACVETFDPFRAPLSESDRARRLAKPLSEQQIANLDRWGYPYVFDAFRFHMTLTGPLEEPLRSKFLDARTKQYVAIAAPLPLNAVAVCRQPAREARFIVLQRFPFNG
jgi:putative phosphonate metabolism protein